MCFEKYKIPRKSIPIYVQDTTTTTAAQVCFENLHILLFYFILDFVKQEKSKFPIENFKGCFLL